MSTCKLASNGGITLNEEDQRLVCTVLQEKIIQTIKYTKNIHLSEDILSNLSTFRHSTLQVIYASLMYDSITPLNILGTVGEHQPSWSDHSTVQLLLQKSSPSFWQPQLARYKEMYGSDEAITRAERILEAIEKDVKECLIYPSKAKYATFLRHMRTTILPRI